jgi:hypothetical protein
VVTNAEETFMIITNRRDRDVKGGKISILG